MIGLIAGIKNGVLQSPFSAPFGGFHFRNEIIYTGELDNYLISLKEYIKSNRLKGIEITLPPDIYHLTFNAKIVNSLFRNGFQIKLLDITNWVNLHEFNGAFILKSSKKYYNQAVRHNLTFEIASLEEDKRSVFDLILATEQNLTALFI